LIFAQLLHSTGAATVSLLAASFFLIAIGLILVYTYRYSFSLHEVFESIKDYKPEDHEVHNEIKKYREGSHKLSSKSAVYGIVFLFLGLWIFVTGFSLAILSDRWESVSGLYSLFSLAVLARFIHFLITAFAITGGAILFAFFY